MCLCVYVCASVCPGVSTPAQTEWVGSVGWLSGLAWSSVDPPPGQFSVRPCQGQPPARGGGSGGQGGGGRFSMTTRHAVSNSNRKGSCTHTLTPRMNFNTNTGTHNKVLIGTYSGKGAACSKPLTLFFTLQIS